MDPSYRQRFSICQQLRRDGLLTGENNDPWSLWEEYPWESISTPSERNLIALMFWIYYTTENPQHAEGLLDLLGKFRTENFTDLSPKFSTFLVLLETLHPIEPENLPTFSRLLWALNGFSQLNPEFEKKIAGVMWDRAPASDMPFDEMTPPDIWVPRTSGPDSSTRGTAPSAGPAPQPVSEPRSPAVLPEWGRSPIREAEAHRAASFLRWNAV